MELTPDERSMAREFVRRFEKDARNWTRNRWIMLLICAYMIGMGGYTQLSFFRKSNEPQKELASVVRFGPRPAHVPVDVWINASVVKAADVLDARYQGHTTGMLGICLGLYLFLTGVIILCYLLLNWNRHLRRGPITKILRWYVEDAIANSEVACGNDVPA